MEKNEKVAVKSGYYFEVFKKDEIPNTLKKSNKKVKINNKIFDLYEGTSLDDERAIDEMFGEKIGYSISEHQVEMQEEEFE